MSLLCCIAIILLLGALVFGLKFLLKLALAIILAIVIIAIIILGVLFFMGILTFYISPLFVYAIFT